MVAPAWNDRFFESTRGRIVALLRRESQTVDELAAALDLTDNAVRLHLGTLERDGVVRAAGVRRDGSVGKPATLYEIAPAAEPSFSNAYLPFLSNLLESLGDRLESAQLRSLMRDVGRRLAAAQRTGATPPSLAARVGAASALLNALGGVTTVERENDRLRIRGCGCPLSVAVGRRAEVCLAMQTMVGEMVGAEVRERCDRGDRPSCAFEIVAVK